jgi:choline dehydrogenase
VVGAGSAGCVVAARLSEDGRHSVLLLEAGPRDRNPWIHIPLGTSKVLNDRRINWCYESEPEPALNGRRIFLPRGKVLGGTSAINGMVYIRGQREDYDGWRDAGNAGWSYADVLPYFRRAECQSRGGDPFHGTRGPLHVSDQPRHELCDAIIAAAAEIGQPRNADFNGAAQRGFGYFQLTTRRGRRCSAAAAYLRPARGRANLQVRTGALATRILLRDGRAAGVAFGTPDGLRAATARAEVIVCGGAFNTPQLLQLSGIGPGALLRANGIPVLLDAPGVGANLQEHLAVPVLVRCRRRVTLNDDAASLSRRLRLGLRYALTRSGPLAGSGIHVGGFFASDGGGGRPDIACVVLNWSAAVSSRDAFEQHRFPAFTVETVLLRPESAGSVRITSPDPAAPPAIRFNLLATDGDRAAIVRGLSVMRRMVHAAALAGYTAEELLPGPLAATEADLLAHCRARGATAYHPVGTCRMGHDGGAVVDARLRVRGVDRLRVIDASVMPSIVSGNTNAPTIMIAEKGADMVLADAPGGAA